MAITGEPDITIKMLVDEGILKAGTKIYGLNNFSGTLNDDGTIILTINDQVRTFPFPSGAARAVEKRSLNGWTYWKVMDEHTKTLKELTYYREKYIEINKRK